ncbi:Endonuclease/Exonuclease/phosphatase family protein [Pseudobythopirellula maris]|uniref:Endonuclease/Exonuclease/phosphatase family protein n=1 Tax=Pseudobythopirellula maris TaxID=2527991 RepID=A0A5C5ZT39_9BACT|nr:endonuclease/exonuclease/phosphatase family protein [Pseudobythopirellula maris]TWT90410.1 Endonuclease/Exonuclease/phosphatase family protein [Pseudobythopirellula maris]
MPPRKMNETSPIRGLCLLAAIQLSASSLLAQTPAKPDEASLRVATYNVSCYRQSHGQLAADFSTPDDERGKKLAEVIQRVRPDVILLNEFDHDPEGKPLAKFLENYLGRSQAGLDPIAYPHRFVAPTNTGEPTGADLDNDGRTDGPADCYGFGRYPGQYGMAVLSRLPIEHESTRTFQKLRWRTMPDARRPMDPTTGEPFDSEEEWRAYRLPSKSMWDVVVRLSPGATMHFVCSHPTPPVFDGPEDRNGRRNADEIRLLADYLSPLASGYIADDRGRLGGLAEHAYFVVAGDLNADPLDGGGIRGAMDPLLKHPAVSAELVPRSEGAAESARRQEELNRDHRGDSAEDTADFGGDGHGNLRVDYVLPSRRFKVVGAGVFWPEPGEAGDEAITATDHRLVWVDLVTGARPGGN